MRARGRRTSYKQRRTNMIIVVSMIIVVAIVVIAYFLWNQTQGVKRSDTVVRQDEMASSSVLDQSGSSTEQNDNVMDDVIEYEGSTYTYNDHLSNYLFIGIDSSEEVSEMETQQDAGQADSIYVVSMDRATEQLQIISIPRDTIAEIEVFNPAGKSLGMTDNHINLQYAYGDGKEKSCELMKTAVSKLLHGIPIQGYYSMNTMGISEVGKLVGDIEIVVPDNSLEEHDPYFKEGAKVVINGDNVEEFLRYRDIEKSQSALVRQQRQKTYLKALIPRIQEKMKINPSFIGNLLKEIEPYTVTNMGNDIFVKLLNAAGNSTLDTQNVPGEGVEGQIYDEYHVNEEELYKLVLSTFYTIS